MSKYTKILLFLVTWHLLSLTQFYWLCKSFKTEFSSVTMWVSALVLTAARQVAFWYIPAGTSYEADSPDQPEEGLLFCLLWLLPLFLTICGIHSSPDCLSWSLTEMSPIWCDQFCQISPFWKRPEDAIVKNSLSPADMRERMPVLPLANELVSWVYERPTLGLSPLPCQVGTVITNTF